MSQQEMPKYDFQNQESSASLAYTSKCEPEVEWKGMCLTQIVSLLRFMFNEGLNWWIDQWSKIVLSFP